MKFLLCILIFTFSSSLYAWGPTGHRVVGEIAEKYLTLMSKYKIKKLTNGSSLARISNWPAERKYCQQNNNLPDSELPQLSYKYNLIFMPVLEKRLLFAGIRLANLLNNIL